MSYYGAIDEGMVARKYETTSMWEDKDQMERMRRETLSDFRNDQPSLESDYARRDYQSTSRIKLRESGSRGDNPEHPEIFIGFMDRDERGIMTDPDYKKFSQQSWGRKRLIEARMNNDDDLSVPSQGIRPEKMQYLLKHSYPEIAKRMKWFSTSKEALKPGMSPVARKGDSSDINKSYAEQERMDNALPDGTQFRRGNTIILSNDSNIGWWQTTDHEFKVASYGKHYKQPGRQNLDKNRRDTRYEIEFATPRIQKPNKQMLALMSTAVNSRHKKHKVGEGDMDFKTGKEGMQGRSPVVAKITELMREALADPKFGNSAQTIQGKTASLSPEQDVQLREFVKTVHKMPAHAQIALREELEQFVGRGRTPQPSDVHPDRNMVVINPKIIQFMDGLVRKSGPTRPVKFGARKDDDVAAADPTIQAEANGPTLNGIEVFVPKTNTTQPNNKQRHETVARLKGTSLKGKVYKYDRPSLNQDRKSKADPEVYAGESDMNLEYAESQQAKDFTRNRRDTLDDNEFGENHAKTRLLAPMGNKYLMRNMDVDHNETELNDIF